MRLKVLASSLAVIAMVLLSVPAAFAGSTTYTWSLSCTSAGPGTLTGKSSSVSWSWTSHGVTIGKGSAKCTGTNILNGSGMRPSSATGFKVSLTAFGCELFKGCLTKTTQMTDPVNPGQPFSVTLSGSSYGESGTFTLAS